MLGHWQCQSNGLFYSAMFNDKNSRCSSLVKPRSLACVTRDNSALVTYSDTLNACRI